MNCNSQAVFTACFVPITITSNFLVLLIIGITYYGVTIEMKPLQHNFHMVLFVLYYVAQNKTFESVYEILWCDHSNQTFTWYYSIFSVCQMELENEATVQSNVHLIVVQQSKKMIFKDESFRFLKKLKEGISCKNCWANCAVD